MKLLEWRVHPKSQELDLPEAILMPVFGPDMPGLAPEIAALLPSTSDPSGWTTKLPQSTAQKRTLCAGVFLGNPLLQRRRVLGDLQASGLAWICNMPSVCQHDADFIANLDEVGLGLERELNNLAACAAAGFRCIASVATPEDAALAQRLGFDRLFVLPKIRAHEGGFPSELSRNRAVAAIAEMPGPTSRVLLSQVKSSETAAPVVWPAQVQGVVEQPLPL